MGNAMDSLLAARCDDLSRAADRLALLQVHDALLILRYSLSAPNLMYTLRTSPCSEHPGLDKFDRILRSTLERVTNVAIDDMGWVQAALPVGEGGLGVRSVALLAPSAFLASAAATLELQDRLLSGAVRFPDLAKAKVLEVWLTRHDCPAPDIDHDKRQANWDKASVKHGQSLLTDSLTNDHHRARLLAAMDEHSGDWLHAWPITSCGLRLDNESIRVAVGLRLGANLCAPHQCPCGAWSMPPAVMALRVGVAPVGYPGMPNSTTWCIAPSSGLGILPQRSQLASSATMGRGQTDALILRGHPAKIWLGILPLPTLWLLRVWQ